MKKLIALLFAAFTLTTNAQTTQGIAPEYISDLCVVSYIHTDSLGFHWTLVHEKASSPNVVFYTIETASLANPTWTQQAFHDYQQASAFVLDTIPFDTATYFRVASFDSQQNLIYTSVGKPMMITDVQESVSHAALTFTNYEGIEPIYYIVYRGNSPLGLTPYDTIPFNQSAVLTYFDPEADSYGFNYYQIGAVRGSTCDENNASGYAAFSAIALSDIALAGSVGVNENQALLNSISLYPNPAQNTININLGLAASGNIQVLNTLGQVVKTAAFDKSGGQKLTLDIGTLPTGVYFVKVTMGNAAKTLRLVKE